MGLQDDIKAVESLCKAADRLTREDQTRRREERTQ